jgi:CHAP domain
MQTLKQFVDSWIGKQLWFNGYDQCVAVAERYIIDVLGEPPVWSNAIDWFGKDATYVNWTANTPTNLAVEGAIIVWHQNYKAGTGIYGHIAIVLGPSCGVPAPTSMEFYSFDQNWGTGANALCRIVKHTYDGVTGWAAPDLAAIAAAKAAADAAAAKQAAIDAAIKAQADAAAAQKAAQALSDAAQVLAIQAAADAALALRVAVAKSDEAAKADAALAALKTAQGKGNLIALILIALGEIVAAILKNTGVK